MILVDSNIPMYLIGAPHPHKADAQRLLERLVSDRQRLVTDAEVLHPARQPSALIRGLTPEREEDDSGEKSDGQNGRYEPKALLHDCWRNSPNPGRSWLSFLTAG